MCDRDGNSCANIWIPGQKQSPVPFSSHLMTESVRLQPGMDEAFSPGDPRICSVVFMSTSVECLMENSITSEGISGVSP